MKTEVTLPIPISLDGLRAGQVVLFDSHHYQVWRLVLTEKMDVYQDLDGPGRVGAAELELWLHRALWIEHPNRSPAAPRMPEKVVTIPVPDHRSSSIVIDGCTYGVAKAEFDSIHSHPLVYSFGDRDRVRLVLVRLWSNDPDRSA